MASLPCAQRVDDLLLAVSIIIIISTRHLPRNSLFLTMKNKMRHQRPNLRYRRLDYLAPSWRTSPRNTDVKVQKKRGQEQRKKEREHKRQLRRQLLVAVLVAIEGTKLCISTGQEGKTREGVSSPFLHIHPASLGNQKEAACIILLRRSMSTNSFIDLGQLCHVVLSLDDLNRKKKKAGTN